ncbi:MAG TPA: SWIM zinc finger family protein, partial [Chloroflexota bacterium]
MPAGAATAAAERAARVLHQGYQATQVGDGIYQVRSANRPDAVYTIRIVNLGQLDATCDCPHGQHAGAKAPRGYPCWHIASALCQE